jgi:hypothetical protein
VNRKAIIRFGAIILVLSLFISLLAGAVSSLPAMADDDPVASLEIDTDGDGIVNNEDPDIDGDGIVNGLDEDIDGDGKPNFEDGDPADTNGGGSLAPKRSTGQISNPVFDSLEETGFIWLLIPGLAAVLVGGLFALRKKRKSS